MNNSSSSTVDVPFDVPSLLPRLFPKDTAEILSFNVSSGSKPGDNFLSLIYAIHVDVRRIPSGEEERHNVIVKCYPRHLARQTFNNHTNVFFKELRLYDTWHSTLLSLQQNTLSLPKLLPLPYPKFFYGEAIDFSSLPRSLHDSTVQECLSNFLVLEDVVKGPKSSRMTNRLVPLDIDHMRLVICALAKVHALGWAYKFHEKLTGESLIAKFPFLKNSIRPEDTSIWTDFAAASLDDSLSALEVTLGGGHPVIAAVAAFKPHIPRITGILVGKGASTSFTDLLRVPPEDKEVDSLHWETITHGDCWSNNFLFRYSSSSNLPVEVTLVDLQLAQHTCITNDLAYALYVSGDSDLRKNHLDSLLQLYVSTFLDLCGTLRCPPFPQFSLHTLQQKLHRAKLAGFYLALLAFPAALKESQGAVDMDSLDASSSTSDLFKQSISVTKTGNAVFASRVTELAEELYAQGII